jgi:hypothetical protein
MATEIFLGVTIKSISEDETSDLMKLSYTLTLKCKEDIFNDLTLNINQSGDIKPSYRNRRLNQDGKLNDPDVSNGLISCSCHFNSDLCSKKEVDCCPFIVTEYSLSIKLNALNEHNKREKKKVIFSQRTFREFVELQENSVGNGVSKLDRINIIGVCKSGNNVNIGANDVDDVVLIGDLSEEVDEILIKFVTKKNQVKNLVNVSIPCMLIPLIFGEISRSNSSVSSNLFTGLLTLVFTMPIKFGFGTSTWYFFSIVLIIINYIVDDSICGLVTEVTSLVGFFIGLWYYNENQKIVTKGMIGGGFQLRDVIKSKNKLEPTWSERFGLI